MRELEVGDSVWIRDDLVNDMKCGDEYWSNWMQKGVLKRVYYVSPCGRFFDVEKDGARLYSLEMVDWDKTDKKDIDSNIIKYKEIFDQLLEVGFTREEALKIMLNAGNVGNK